MKIMFILKNGANIRMEIPAELNLEFNFGAFITRMRADGYMQSPEAHVKYDECMAVMWLRDGGPSVDIRNLNS